MIFAAGLTLSTIEPAVFDGLGAYKGPVYTFATLLGMGVTAYLKGDPLRQNYAAQVEAERARRAEEEQGYATDPEPEAEPEPDLTGPFPPEDLGGLKG